MLEGEGKLSVDRLRSDFYNSIFTFPEVTFHEFSLAPYKSIDISAKKNRIKNSRALQLSSFFNQFFDSPTPDTNSIIKVFNFIKYISVLGWRSVCFERCLPS
jgi:hypothetical protein